MKIKTPVDGLNNKCAKNLYKRTVLVQRITKNVVTCFLEHSVDALSVLCAQLTRDLLAIAKFSLFKWRIACSVYRKTV